MPGFSDGEKFVLVVDNDDNDRAMLVELLSREGLSSLEARDGKEALDLLEERPVGLGVLALALPGMSGAELAWRIKSHSLEITLVAVSGHLATWDRDDLMDLGFDDIFSKPLNRERFVRFCRHICGEEAGASDNQG